MISKKNNKEKHKKQIEKINEYQEELDRKYKEEKQKYTFKSLLSRLKSESYTKTIVAIVVFVALIDLQLSYVLAFLDKEQIAETLSVQVCITILGTVLVYIIREYFDAKAEKRGFGHFKEIVKSLVTPAFSGIDTLSTTQFIFLSIFPS